MTRGGMWLLAMLCVLLPAAGGAQQASPLTEEEALHKAVTVQDKMILAPDLLREVGRQTGGTLPHPGRLRKARSNVYFPA